ncbi:hypothetical protein SCLCIDRAFT_30264 [Scleroderma citrinum Foug A]|uniref:Uncharacterized protein n=1 Tax=Scleroderma citrinum Foug A TaxID=1036808 RepID=A0A0C3DGS8_9AGAM|nr:hypothetical protein SCLCIDRAFT_30264 [Scleroderma citrinum Foug A]
MADDIDAVNRIFLKYLQGKEAALTINDLHVYFEVHLRNRKGWQKKSDKGPREIDLCSNRYKIYPHPDLGRACDSFFWILFWMNWVKYSYLGQAMSEGDFLFPALRTTRLLEAAVPILHDMVQKLLDEALAGAKITGKFSMHCFRRSEGEQNNTLMWYLLDELHSYEEDYSDALAPTLREASALFAGEAALVRPASMEALHMAHVALTSDVAALHKTVVQVSASQDALAQDMRLIREALVPGSRTLASPQDMNVHHHPSIQTTLQPSLIPTVAPSQPPVMHWQPAIQPHAGTQLSHPVRGVRASELSPSSPTGNMSIPSPVPATHSNMAVYPLLPSLIGAQRTSRALPAGLTIPHIPVLHPNGLKTPPSESWRDIVWHWMVGEPRLRLFVTLKDWLHHYYNGQYGRQFNTLYRHRSIVATEFLNVFKENEEDWYRAYGSAIIQGHKKLKDMIQASRKVHSNGGEHRRFLLGEALATE